MNELVTNAMKYAFPVGTRADGTATARPELTVTTAFQDETFNICVKDNGPGLPDSFRPDTPSGFGLTMVQAMVTQLDGTIQFESSQRPESHGTRVALSFPRSGKR